MVSHVQRTPMSDARLPGDLPPGWSLADREKAAHLHTELQCELPPGHRLHGVRLSVVAHRDGATDDILCRYDDEPNRYTVVHLTWSRMQGVDDQHPSVEVDGD